MASRVPRAGYLLIGFVMNLLLGTAYSWSVIKVGLQAEFAVDDVAALLPFAAVLVMFAAGMVLSGRLVDRHGPRRVAVIGGLVFGAGYLLSGFALLTPWPIPALTLAYGVVVGLGTGFGYGPTITTANQWFPVRKGLASGIVVMGVGLSPVLTAPLAAFFISLYGVAVTFLLLGVIFLAALVPLGSLLRSPPEGWQPPAELVARTHRIWQPVTEMETRQMVRTSSFWTAWTLYVLGTAGGFMIIGNATSLASEIGHITDAALITGAVQLLAIFNSSGRPLFGRLADAWTPKRALLLMYAILLGGMALLASAADALTLFVGIALVGVVFGGYLAVMPALATLFFGARNAGANYGALFTAFGAGSVVALFAGGAIRDATGSYIPAFYVGIGMSALGLLLAFLVRPPRPASAARGP